MIKEHLGKGELGHMGCSAPIFISGVNAGAKVALRYFKITDTPVRLPEEFVGEGNFEAIVVFGHDAREQTNRDACRHRSPTFEQCRGLDSEVLRATSRPRLREPTLEFRHCLRIRLWIVHPIPGRPRRHGVDGARYVAPTGSRLSSAGIPSFLGRPVPSRPSGAFARTRCVPHAAPRPAHSCSTTVAAPGERW